MFGGACMSEKLDFYEVNVDYVKYLKQFDSRIPNVEYQNRNKFLCGTLFKINGLNYFAPVSSFNIKQSSNYVIEVGNVPVGSVRYSFMFPVPDAEIKQKVINNESDYQYRFLLRQELKYCNKNREVIQSKAKAIYHKALDKNTTYHQFCCDFQLLEKKCKEWIYDKTIEKHEKGIPMYKFSFQEKMTLLELTKDRHMIELLAVDHNEVIKNKATDKLKKIDEATKKVSPVHELLKQKETVPHKIYFTDYQTTVRLELIKDSICYYKNELNNSIYALERKDAHLPQVMQRMLEPYLKANEKNTNVYVLTDSDLANSNYHSLLIEYQNYPDTLFDEWIDGNEINKIGNKYIFTAGMELNDFLKMEYLKDFQQGNVNILGVDGKKYISLEDLVNFDVDRYSEKCLNVVYENEKRESQMQEKIMQFHFNLEFVNKKYKNADVVLKVWATEICREQGLSDYYPVQDVKDAFKTMEYIDEKEAVEIVLNDSEETLIYHKSPEEEYFTREALKHETINFDKESEIEEDLDELEK